MVTNDQQKCGIASRNSDPTEPLCNCLMIIFLILLIFVLPIYFMAEGIRRFTQVDPVLYSESCNITGLVSLNELHYLQNKRNSFDQILEKDTWKNRVGGKRSSEIEKAQQEKKETITKIKIQIENRQKCAGINIRKDQKNITDKAFFWAMWLFRTGSILVFAYGCILYKFSKIMIKFSWLNIIPFNLIVSLFICAGMSVSEYFFMRDFDERLINFE